jgi:hypothetical protein
MTPHICRDGVPYGYIAMRKIMEDALGRTRNWIVLVSCFGLVTTTLPAEATLVKSFSLRSMTYEAQAIVHGVVVDEEVVYDRQRDRVYTHTFVRVDRVLYGREKPGQLIVVRQMGGMLDGIDSVLVGTASLALGSELILFTRTDGAFHYLIGMSQGSYRVDRNHLGPASLTRSRAGARLRPLRGPAHPVAPDRMTLAELETLVGEYLSTLRKP